MAATASWELPGDLGRRLAEGDTSACLELIAARAGAVHAYAVAAGVSEGHTSFIVSVLGCACGAADVDRRLLAVAADLAAPGGGAHGRLRSARRRRRAVRSFDAARSAAVPAAVAGSVLRLLTEAAPAAAGPAAAGAAAAGVAARRPRPACGPADWLPASLHHVNGASHALPRPPAEWGIA